MQLVLDFSQWLISPRQGIVGRQYDNLSHSLVVVGDLPAGYTWDMLVEARGKYNVIPLTSTETGASAPLTDDQLAFGDTYYAFQLRGVQGDLIHHTNAVQVYVPETIVGPGTWPVLPTEFSQAEANIRELNAHPPVPGENGYWMLWDLDTHSYVQSQLVVPGLRIKIGETTTGEPGTPAKVTNSGTNTAPVLNFTIPEGEKGDAATIQVGEVTASDPGSKPQVRNSGTENAAVFDFVLPRGQTGPTGQAATIEVESTVTSEPGTQASVENVGTTGAAKLRFTIPRGNTGQNGVTPTLAAGNVETLEPGQPATASVTGEGPAYQINLGIPRGQTGAQGAPGQDGQDGQDGQTPTIAVGTVTTLDPGQDATAEITGETPNLTLNLGIPQGPPGQDGVQLNDSAITTTEAWSSKKIVDTLCPAFSVSGNPVTCNPVEGYPLSAVVTLEPKQAGSGDPSPDNVRPISGYDSVTVTRCGNNLLNGECVAANIFNKGGTPALTNGNGTTISGLDVSNLPIHVEQALLGAPEDDGSYKNGYISIKTPQEIPDDTEMVISLRIRVTSALSHELNHWIVLLSGVEAVSPKFPVNPTSQEVQTITLSFKFSDMSTVPPENRLKQLEFRIAGMSFDILEIQLEVGSTPTAYEPYQGDTSTLTLPETIYGGTVDAVSGVGSKTWGYIASYNGESLPGEWISDRDVYSDGTSPTTGAQVAYKLATPEPFQATGNQALPAVAGLNTVYTDGDSLAVSGRQDLLYTLQNMQAQTQNLNRFIAEGGTR